MELNTALNPNFKTMILECRDCGCDFLLTDQEQLSFYRKNLAMPKRCPECRQANRKALTDQTTDRASGKVGGNG